MLLLQRLLGALLGVALLVTAFVVTSVLLAVVVVAALILWAWAWWRTGKLRRRSGPGEVIEGEYRVERESRVERKIPRGGDAP